MASVTLLTADGDTSNSASYLTASISPTASRLYLAAVMNSRGSGVGTVDLAGCGLTWEHIGDVDEPVTWNSEQRKISLFRATGTPTTGQLTITISVSGSGCLWSVFEIDGAPLTNNGADAMIQAAQATTGSGQSGVTVTMAAFADPGNIALGLFGNLNQEDLTPGDGFTELSDVNITSPNSSFLVEYKLAADTTIDASAAGTSSWGALGVEIAVADEAVVAAPTDLVVTGETATTADLAWTDNATNEDRYAVEVSLDQIDWTVVVDDLPADTASYQLLNLDPDTQYFVRVRAGISTSAVLGEAVLGVAVLGEV